MKVDISKLQCITVIFSEMGKQYNYVGYNLGEDAALFTNDDGIEVTPVEVDIGLTALHKIRDTIALHGKMGHLRNYDRGVSPNEVYYIEKFIEEYVTTSNTLIEVW